MFNVLYFVRTIILNCPIAFWDFFRFDVSVQEVGEVLINKLREKNDR